MNSDPSITSYDLTLKIQHIIKFEIWNNLPRLENNEYKLRENINKQVIFKKDRLRDFVQALKKKYTNFYQLAYFEDEEVSNFYDNLIFFESFKEKLLKSIDINEFLYKFYQAKLGRKNSFSINENDDLIKFNLRNISNNEIIEKSKSWFILNFDVDLFKEIYVVENKILYELLKYNPTFDMDSISIEINTVYPDMIKDLDSFLMYKTNVRNIMISITGKQEVIFNKNSTMRLSEMTSQLLDHWINKLLQVVLTKLKIHNQISFLSIICENCHVSLDENTTSLLNSLFEFNSSICIFIMKNFSFGNNNPKEFFNTLLNSKALRYLHLEGMYNDENILTDFEKKLENRSDRCYLRFGENHLFNNFSLSE
jgi:hypothetical protein